MDYRDVCLIGGDRRISYMAPILSWEGCRVLRFDEPSPSSQFQEALGGAGTVICGIPFEKNGRLFCEKGASVSVAEFQRLLRKRQMIFGGLFPDHFLRRCEERSIECHDFMKDEALTLFNAVATAEGAILEALSNREALLHQSNCLVLGFGRCGSLIAQRLWGLHASVTVAVRDPAELAMAMARGHQTLPLAELPEKVARFDYVFNTIPACYLGEKCLPQVRQDCLIIDVASGRTGVDYELARDLSLHVLFCPGLPGKYAAKSCAERLVKYVLQIIGSKSS